MLYTPQLTYLLVHAPVIGINVSGTLNTRKVLTLAEVEERRRVWWAIVTLDRFVSGTVSINMLI
jgi:hypothetical protein